MTNVVNPIPEGFHTVTPYLMGPDVDGLVAPGTPEASLGP